LKKSIWCVAAVERDEETVAIIDGILCPLNKYACRVTAEFFQILEDADI
jgi:hypothetical protein